MNTLGSVTSTKVLKIVDGTGAIFEGFIAKADLAVGQKVKLEGSTGKVEALAKGDAETSSVGTVIKPAVTGEYVTVQTKFKSIITGVSKAACVAGPVKLEAYDADGIMEVDVLAGGGTPDSTELIIGYNLEPTAVAADVTVGLI